MIDNAAVYANGPGVPAVGTRLAEYRSEPGRHGVHANRVGGDEIEPVTAGKAEIYRVQRTVSATQEVEAICVVLRAKDDSAFGAAIEQDGEWGDFVHGRRGQSVG